MSTSWMQELHVAVANDDMATFKSIVAKEEVRKDLEVGTVQCKKGASHKSALGTVVKPVACGITFYMIFCQKCRTLSSGTLTTARLPCTRRR